MYTYMHAYTGYNYLIPAVYPRTYQVPVESLVNLAPVHHSKGTRYKKERQLLNILFNTHHNWQKHKHTSIQSHTGVSLLAIFSSCHPILIISSSLICM